MCRPPPGKREGFVMKKQSGRIRVLAILLTAVFLVQPMHAHAKTALTKETFDSKRYADTYADLKAAFGYDHAKLWEHYVTFGAKENRKVYTIGGDAVSVPAAAQSAALTSANFDSRRYADTYADLKAAFGYDHAKLWNHYVTFGAKEGRTVYTTAGVKVQGTAAAPQIASIEQMKQYPAFRNYMNDAEFQMAYTAARVLVEPLVGKDQLTQAKEIAAIIARQPRSKSIYQTHADDPYGLLYRGVASNAGFVRVTGFLLRMLGIPYEHVNENGSGHQWVRAHIGGKFYCVDGQVGIVQEELGPYRHPWYIP